MSSRPITDSAVSSTPQKVSQRSVARKQAAAKAAQAQPAPAAAANPPQDSAAQKVQGEWYSWMERGESRTFSAYFKGRAVNVPWMSYNYSLWPGDNIRLRFGDIEIRVDYSSAKDFPAQAFMREVQLQSAFAIHEIKDRKLQVTAVIFTRDEEGNEREEDL